MLGGSAETIDHRHRTNGLEAKKESRCHSPAWRKAPARRFDAKRQAARLNQFTLRLGLLDSLRPAGDHSPLSSTRSTTEAVAA
jgi:hypothetical protein